MNTLNIHAIGNLELSASISGDKGCTFLKLLVGGTEVNFFLHGNKAERSLAAIEEAIRVWQMEHCMPDITENELCGAPQGDNP